MGRTLILCFFLLGCASNQHLVIFSETSGYRHDSIEEGAVAITKVSEEMGFKVTHTEDSSDLVSLEYSTLVFLSPTLDVLNEVEQQHLRSFVEQGGGFVGVHSATNCEYEFDWYIDTLVGAKFDFHREVKSLDIDVIDTTHPSTAHLQNPWSRTDEWYAFDRTPENVTVLLEIEDEDGRRPIAWCREVGKGRSFYSGGGHTKESFSDPQFLKHLEGGIEWVSAK